MVEILGGWVVEILHLTRYRVTGHPTKGEALDSARLCAWISDQRFSVLSQIIVFLTELSMAGQLAVGLGKKTAVPTVCLLAMMSPMMSSSMVPSRSAPVKAGRRIDQNLSRFTTLTTLIEKILNLYICAAQRRGI